MFTLPRLWWEVTRPIDSSSNNDQDEEDEERGFSILLMMVLIRNQWFPGFDEKSPAYLCFVFLIHIYRFTRHRNWQILEAFGSDKWMVGRIANEGFSLYGRKVGQIFNWGWQGSILWLLVATFISQHKYKVLELLHPSALGACLTSNHSTLGNLNSAGPILLCQHWKQVGL